MPVVRLLDDLTVNQIAAGEVVERPAAAVKELVENALDAGATRIAVDVEEGGRSLIRVTDNGCGMAPEDAELALQRHATSKILSADDLTRLRTLGFRGEALPSIASVSHLELITRPPGADAATRIALEGGTILVRGEVGAPQGTRIAVRHLFYNTPARLKFIKSDTTELNHIIEIAGRLAMAHPEAAIRLAHNGREVFSTPGTGEARDALAALWGRERAAALLPAQAETPAAAVTGYVSPPEESRPNRAQQAFFINGRPIVSRLLSHAVDNTVRPLIPEGRFAAAAIFLEAPPEDIDVNVHPSKTEVRFRNEREIHSAVSRAVRAALMHVPEVSRRAPREEIRPGLLRPLGHDRPADLSPERFMPPSLLGRGEAIAPVWQGVEIPRAPSPEGDVSSPQTEGAGGPFSAQIPPATPEGEGAVQGPAGEEIDRHPAGGEIDQRPEGGEIDRRSVDGEIDHRRLAPAGPPYTGFAPIAPPPEAKASPVADLLGGMRLLGQVMNTFLVGEGRDGIILIDQHVAHERILYDRLVRAQEGRTVLQVQRLLLPLTVTLSNREAAALEARLADLEKLGFEIEPFGGGTFLVRALPVDLSYRNPEVILRDLAADLTGEWDPHRSVMERAIDAVLASAACHGAIKANMALGPAEMQRLVEDLIRTEDPFHCPHGRPIIVRITAAELLKWFKRTG